MDSAPSVSSPRLPVDPLRSHPVNGWTAERELPDRPAIPTAGRKMREDKPRQSASAPPRRKLQRSSSVMFNSSSTRQSQPPSAQSARSSIDHSSKGTTLHRSESTLRKVMRKALNRKRADEPDHSGSVAAPSAATPSSLQDLFKNDDRKRALRRSASLKERRIYPITPALQTQTSPSLPLAEGRHAVPDPTQASRVCRTTHPNPTFTHEMQGIFATILPDHDTAKDNSEAWPLKDPQPEQVPRSPVHTEWPTRSVEPALVTPEDRRWSFVPEKHFTVRICDTGGVTVSDRPSRESTVQHLPEIGTTPPCVSTAETEPCPTSDSSRALGDNRGTVSETGTHPHNAGHLISSIQCSDDCSMEQRLTTLEVKLIDLEYAIDRMQSQCSEAADSQRKTVQKQISAPAVTRSHRSRRTSSEQSDRLITNTKRTGEDQPLSTGTIRPAVRRRSRTVVPTSSSCSEQSENDALTPVQYNALLTQLRKEQQARKALENNMAVLQEHLRRLQCQVGDTATIAGRANSSSAQRHHPSSLTDRKVGCDSRSASAPLSDEVNGGHF